MFTDMSRDPGLLNADRQRRNTDHFRVRLADIDRFAAFVVDQPDGRLAATAVGWLNEHLIGTKNTVGRMGHIANMSSDPGFRRRGYAQATLTELLTWMRSSGITTVDLHATPDGENLYRQMGFTESVETALTLRLR